MCFSEVIILLNVEEKNEVYCGWPQEALIPAIDDSDCKVFVYPKDSLMKINVLSYGKTLDEAKQNVKGMCKLAPDFSGTGIMASFLLGHVMGHNPEEFTFDEIKELMDDKRFYIRVGDSVYGA